MPCYYIGSFGWDKWEAAKDTDGLPERPKGRMLVFNRKVMRLHSSRWESGWLDREIRCYSSRAHYMKTFGDMDSGSREVGGYTRNLGNKQIIDD